MVMLPTNTCQMLSLGGIMGKVWHCLRLNDNVMYSFSQKTKNNNVVEFHKLYVFATLCDTSK